jgi:hypothetical protein
MTRLDELRANGEGNALADAIESMPEGLGQYKMRQYWGWKGLTLVEGWSWRCNRGVVCCRTEVWYFTTKCGLFSGHLNAVFASYGKPD